MTNIPNTGMNHQPPQKWLLNRIILKNSPLFSQIVKKVIQLSKNIIYISDVKIYLYQYLIN
jgi:hypothetical protein